MPREKKKRRGFAVVGNLLDMMLHASPPATAPAEKEEEPLLAPAPVAAPAPSTQGVDSSQVPAQWGAVNLKRLPKQGDLVRLDQGELRIWRSIYLVYLKDSMGVSWPKDFALLTIYPDPGTQAAIEIVALSRVEVVVRWKGDGKEGAHVGG